MLSASDCSVLLCGVGGQGTILAADLLAKTALASGFDAKLSEIHGMSQRGGSVNTMVRFGQEVKSAVIGPGCADLIVSFELVEALRYFPLLAPNGHLVVNDEIVLPLPVRTGVAEVPRDAREFLLEHDALLVPASELAISLGNLKCANVVLTGALSARLPFEVSVWEDVIVHRVPPKTVETNLAAFQLGRSVALQG